MSEENRAKAAERLAAARVAKKLAGTEETAVAVEERPREMAPVVDSMDPARRAKLEQIQARNLANLAQTEEGREALARLEARKGITTGAELKPVVEAVSPTKRVEEFMEEIKVPVGGWYETPLPPKPAVREIPMKAPFRLTGSISGLMVSELGPCWCGEPKLKWHAICLKVRA